MAIPFTSNDFFYTNYIRRYLTQTIKYKWIWLWILCLYWLLQCVRNGFFKVEVIGVSGCDLRVSQGDWRSLMLAPPRASFLRHGWLHHHFSICCPFVKTLSGLCNFGHSYWGAICQTAFQVETFKFSQVLATSIYVARFPLHLQSKLWHICSYSLLAFGGFADICVLYVLVFKNQEGEMYLSSRKVCTSPQERKEVCELLVIRLIALLFQNGGRSN